MFEWMFRKEEKIEVPIRRCRGEICDCACGE